MHIFTKYFILGNDKFHGEDVEKWQKKLTFGHKVNKYTMWVKWAGSKLDPSLRIAIPVHYEMKGFNNLLGSHYDHYYVTYEVREKDSKLKTSASNMHIFMLNNT